MTLAATGPDGADRLARAGYVVVQQATTDLPPVAGPEPFTSTLPADVPLDWWSRVQDEIRSAEYQVTWQDQTYLTDLPAAYHAANRAQNLRTYFAPDGIRVIRRTETEPAWVLGLSLVAYGRSSHVRPVANPALSAAGSGASYDRGAVREWYVNDEQGLEQGFILQPPADDRRAGDPLILQLAVPGNLTPGLADGQGMAGAEDTAAVDDPSLPKRAETDATDRLAPEERAVEFTTTGGVRAVDAAGRPLSTTLSVRWDEAGQRYVIQIAVDDSDAAYPITVAPLLTSPDWTAEGDQATAYFGIAVSSAGDVNGDGYDDVIASAYSYDNGQTNEGRTYLYCGTPSGLSNSPAWTGESDQASAYFGISVSTAGAGCTSRRSVE